MSTIHKSKAAGLTASFFASVLMVSTVADAANDKKPTRGHKRTVVSTSPVIVPVVPTPVAPVSVNPAPPPVVTISVQ